MGKWSILIRFLIHLVSLKLLKFGGDKEKNFFSFFTGEKLKNLSRNNEGKEGNKGWSIKTGHIILSEAK